MQTSQAICFPRISSLVTGTILVLLLGLDSLWAQVARPGALLVDSAQANQRLWMINLGISYGQSLFPDPLSEVYSPDTATQISLFYRGFQSMNLIASSGIQYSPLSQRWDMNGFNLRWNLKKPWIQSSSWLGLIGFSAQIPPETSKRISSLQAMTQVHLNFMSQDLGAWTLISNYSLQYFFHEYENNLSSQINPWWGQTLGFNGNYNINSQWMLSFSLGYRFRQNYAYRISESLFHSQDLTYFLNQNQSLTLGHSWGAWNQSLWKANGQDLNLDVWSEQGSYVYLNYGLSI